MLSQKYAALKKRVGGNREVMGYEDTFGMPREEQWHVTAPGKMIVRILSEIEFAIRLSEELSHKYDAIIDTALDMLTAEMDRESVLTDSVCKKAEETLLPMSPDAGEYKLILAGHAHIDMNWMWSWQETVASTLATFRTMLNIMDEYPEFCFSQSQTSVYKIVEDYEPELMDAIKARIAEGRWEITASSWVETDKNMPNTESLLRHIKYTKNYLRDKWGVNADSLEIDFSPDTFGHSANLPEIDAAGGVKYYYHCRGLDGNNALYRWRGKSGKEMLVYREQYWYNSGITPKVGIGIIDIAKRCAGFKTGLVVYGVGDHGGGPTRRDVERAIDMMSWPVFPKIRFGTFREFFHEAESVRDRLPLVDREMNFIFMGCYTTQSRIKMGNRRSEAALADAESLAVFAKQKAGAAFHGQALENAWRKVLFTHFHDILTGSCVQDSREYAMGLLQDALATAETEYTIAAKKLSDSIDTSALRVTEDISASQSEGAGAGYNADRFGGKPKAERGAGLTRIFTVFNPTGVDKNEPVQIAVWDWTGDMRYIKVTDADGKPVEIQLLDNAFQHYWDHKYFRFLANVRVKAFGYTTLVLSQGEMNGNYPLYYRNEIRTDGEAVNIVLENDCIRAEFDRMTGEMVSMKDKETDTEYIRAGERAGFRLVDTETRSSNAWNIGHYLAVHPVTKVTRIGGSACGELRRGISFEAHILGSVIRADYYIEKNSRFVTLKAEIDWREVGADTIPVLIYSIPVSYGAKKYMYNIPAGYEIRDAAEADRPGLSYAAAVNENKGGKYVTVVTDTKYGFRGTREGELISTLINTSTSPDPYPERGIHNITLNIGLLCGCPKCMEESAVSAVRRLTYTSTGCHAGALPATGALLSFDCPGAVVSSVSVPDDGDGLLVRVYSVAKEEKTVSFDFGTPVRTACEVDLLDRPTASAVPTVSSAGTKVTAKLASFAVMTVKVTF